MAEFDDGRLNFGVGLDLSTLNGDVKEMVNIFESGAVKINDAFNVGRSVDATRKNLRDMISATKSAIREIEQDYRDLMEVASQMGGADKLSKESQEWLKNLKDAIAAAKEQLKGLQENLQEQNLMKGGFLSGLTSGVQGLMGAYAAASGVLARFNADEEKLAKIQTKLQSSMSILMGLQQLQNNLQSMSAFRLQIVTRLTDLYAKAQARLAAASGLAKVALGGIAVAAAAAIAILVKYASKQKEAFADSDEVLEATAKSAAAQLTAYRKLQIEWDKANGSLERQREILKDSGWDEVGIAVSDVNEAESVLVTNSQSVVQSFLLRAKAAQLYAKAQEDIEAAAEKDLKADKAEQDLNNGKIRFWERMRGAFVAGNDASGMSAEDWARVFAEGRIERLRKKSGKSMKEADDLLSQAGDLEQQAEDTVKAFGGKTKEAAQKVVDGLQKEVEEVNRIISNAINHLDDYEVDVIEDAGQRSLAAMKLAHRRKLEEMEKEQRELEEAYRKQNLLAGETNVDPNTGLTAEQTNTISRFEAARKQTEEYFSGEEAQEAARTFNEILKQYRGFGTKYNDITEDYLRKWGELIVMQTDENRDEVEEALEELRRDYQKTLAELGQDLAESGRDLDFSRWVDQLADMSLMDLQIELQTKTDDLELLSELFPEESEQVAELRTQIAMLNEAIRGYNEEKEVATDKDKWTELAQVIEICRKSVTELGDSIGGAFGDAVKSIGETLGSMGQLANAASELKVNPESMTARFTVITSAIEGIAGLIGNIINKVKESKEAMEAWSDTVRQCAHEYALLQIESQKYQQRNLFGVENPYQKAIDSAKEYAAAIGELQKQQDELNKGEVQTGTKKVTDWEAVAKNAGLGASAGAAIGTAVGGWAMGLGTIIGGAIGAVVGGISGLFTQKVQPIMESLTSQYGQLFDPETYKLNPQLLADYDKLDEDTKKIVDNWDEIVKKAEEAKNAMKENFASLAGDIGTQLSDALVNAFTNGDIYAAVDDFQAYTTSAIENIIEQMIFAQAFGDLFDELEQKFNESFLGESADQNLVDDLIWFSEQYRKRLEEYNDMMGDAQDALGELGFDLWGKTEDRRARTRSSLGASQDSIDESNARLTTIQAHTYELNENVRLMREQNEELRLRTTEILAEVMGIHSDTTAAGLTLAEMMAYMKEMRMDISTIVDKGVTILS